MGDTVRKEISVPLAKVDDEKQIVYGVVYEPMVEDTQGDMMTAAEIEKAAHWFMANSQLIKESHDDPIKARPVESYVAPTDMEIGGQTVRKGSWIMAVKILDPQLWKLIKEDGYFTGFSMGAFGKRRATIN